VAAAAPYKFTGKERDGESGLDFFIARYYSSGYGRFLSPDEFTGGPVDAYGSNDPLAPGPLPHADVSNPQSLAKYTYTWNNPIRYVDPNGHDVTVTPYQGRGGNPFGHIGLGVNTNRTQGLYPSPQASTRDVLRGKPVPGVVQEDTGRAERTVVIPTTKEEDQQVQQFINNAVQNPPQYDLNDNNCSDFVRQGLAAGGITVDDVVRPEAQMQSAEREARRRRDEAEKNKKKENKPGKNEKEEEIKP